jgi:hypothetical protein
MMNESAFKGPAHYELDEDSDGRPIRWRVYDAFDVFMCDCYSEEAAKWIVERLGN